MSNDICPITDLDREICGHCGKKEQRYTAPPTDSGIADGVPEKVYHADRNSLSSSGARKILRCPALFKHERDHGPERKDEYDFGSVAHKYVLGEGSEVEVVAADSWRTTKAKDQKAEAYAAGKVPILTHEDAKARVMAAKVRDHPLAAELLAAGWPEQSMYWNDPVAWVRLRSRVDWMVELDGRLVLVDYKTTKDAEPQEFSDSAARYGYHQQAAWYLAGVRELELHPDPRFVFIAQEKTEPFLVSVHEYTAEDIAVGEEMNRRAIDIYARCLATDTWPAYGDHIHTMRLPRWARAYEGA